MAIRDLSSARLYVDAPLAAGATLRLEDGQAHYLINVLRMPVGSPVLVFNGRDGEWRADVAETKKRAVLLIARTLTRPQTVAQDIDYLFAPLKHARLDYMVQKAVELGASRLVPVLTQHTVAERINLERMRANVIEAAEQCGVLNVPEVAGPSSFESVLANWDARRTLIFCDEAAERRDPVADLSRIPLSPLAVLIGPEGGFSARERDVLLQKPYVKSISLGPRIMRADTAAVAALSLVNATLGDWR